MQATRAPRAAARGLVVMAAVGLCGCGGGSPPPTDKAEGVAVLRAVLEAWQSGQTLDSLKDGNPPVTVVDHVWARGAKLIRFEIDESAAEPSGHDLGCPAKLWLGDEKKPPVQVRYVVALKPVRVVTRDFGS